MRFPRTSAGILYCVYRACRRFGRNAIKRDDGGRCRETREKAGKKARRALFFDSLRLMANVNLSPALRGACCEWRDRQPKRNAGLATLSR